VTAEGKVRRLTKRELAALNGDPATRGGISNKHGQQRASSYGTPSVQHTLPHGTREDVVAEVRHRILVVGRDAGLILAPAHAMQPDTPVENALAIYETADSMDR